MEPNRHSTDTTNLKNYFLNHRTAFIGLLGVGLAAYGFHAFNLLLVGDDWGRSTYYTQNYDIPISVGRWGMAALWFLFSDNRISPSFSVSLCVVLVSVSGVLISKMFGAKNDLEVFLCSALILVNPILASHFAFPSHHISIGFGFLFVALSLYHSNKIYQLLLISQPRSLLTKDLFLAITYLTLSSGIRQSFFLFALAVFTASILNALSKEESHSISLPEVALKGIRTYGTVLVLGFTFWLAIWKSSQFLFGVSNYSDHNYQFISTLPTTLTECVHLLARFKRYFSQFLLDEQHLWSFKIKIFFLLTLSIYIWKLSEVARSANSRRSRTYNIAIVWAFTSLLLVSPWLIGLIRLPANSYRYTALLGLVPIYSFIVVSCLSLLRDKRLYYVIATLALVTVTNFTQSQSSAALAVKLRNDRDLVVAQNIMTQIENHERYPQLSKDYRIHFIGYSRLCNRHERLFCNISTLPMATSAVDFISLPRNFDKLTSFIRMSSLKREQIVLGLKTIDKNEIKRIEPILKKAKAWPHYSSIQIIGNRVFVVLTNTSKKIWPRKRLSLRRES